MRFTIKRTRLLIILGAVMYVTVLDLLYALYISPYFSYLGYSFIISDIRPVILAHLIALVPSFFLPIALAKPSQVVLWILYILAFVPSTVVPHYTVTLTAVNILGFNLAVLLAFMLLTAGSYLRPFDIPRIRVHRPFFWGVLSVLSLGFLALIISVFGISFSLPSFAEVYETRSSYADSVSASSSLLAYAVSWSGNVISPFFIAIGFFASNPLLIFLGIGLQLVLYGITGFKSLLFSSLLLFALILALQKRGRYFGIYMIWGVVIAIALSFVLDLFSDRIIFTSLFVRRLLITPGLMAGYFLEFFSQNPLAYLGHSIFESFVSYPYEAPPPYIIGQTYYGRFFSANANIWADAFANFSYLGVILFMPLLSLVLWLFDSLARGRNHKQKLIIALILGMPSFALANSALLTSLLSHGILFSFILLYFMPQLAVAEAGSAPRRRIKLMLKRDSP